MHAIETARLSYPDWPADPARWAAAVGSSVAAAELLAGAPFVDLHNDLEVPVRLVGYDPAKHHGISRVPLPFYGHTDWPRIRQAGFKAVAYDLATNVFRRAPGRQAITLANVARVRAAVARYPEDLAIVTDCAGLDAAISTGRTALLLTLQGGNALAHDPSVLDGELGRWITRITLVHLTNSELGGTNSPSGGGRGITDAGRAFVERCNASRVLVDLAHASRRTFWDALAVHATDLPPVVTHTGLDAVRPHWRNIDDDQVRAIADRGGVVGVVYQGNFLARVPPGFPCRRAAIVAHLAHLWRVGGEDVLGLGSDYDGMITPPWDLPDVTGHPLLVDDLLRHGFPERVVHKLLGANFIRAWRGVRPG